MKVVAFNGSSRKDGNTAILLNLVMDELKKERIETELVQLTGETLSGCIACRRCAENKDRRCAVVKDRVNEYIAKIEQSPRHPSGFTYLHFGHDGQHEGAH